MLDTHRTKSLCFVLIYKEFDIIKKSLECLVHLSDEVDIVVIENASVNSHKIKQLINGFGVNLKVKRYYQFAKNITNNAYDIIINLELQEIKKYKYTIVTDGDLITSDIHGWYKEASRIITTKDVFCCGAKMITDNLPLSNFPDASNWIPQLISRGTIDEGRTGCHFLMFRSSDLRDFMAWKNKGGKSFTDREIFNYCYKIAKKKWTRTKQHRVYHLTWDLYNDLDNEYTKLKRGKSFKNTWYHQRKSVFELVKY